MESGLRNGGLGGVDNYADWEKKLQNAKTIKEFVSVLFYDIVSYCMNVQCVLLDCLLDFPMMLS